MVLAGRDPEALDRRPTTCSATGADTVEVVALDALATDGHDAFVDDLFNRHGHFDLVLIAFEVLGDQEEAERDTDAAMTVLRTNFVGAASVALPVARRLRTQGHGTLLVLSSMAGERARRANFVYGSSKAGLDAFCQGLGDRRAPSRSTRRPPHRPQHLAAFQGGLGLTYSPGIVLDRLTRTQRRILNSSR